MGEDRHSQRGFIIISQEGWEFSEDMRVKFDVDRHSGAFVCHLGLL